MILPLPDGVVRSGSKPGSRYKSLFASTNDAYCPTLRGFAPETKIPDGVGCGLERVSDGLEVPMAWITVAVPLTVVIILVHLVARLVGSEPEQPDATG